MEFYNDYRVINESSFRQYYEVLNDYLLAKYNIAVYESEVVDLDEFIGSFNGKNITVKKGLNFDHKLFLILHLFGHCVQWCGLNQEKYLDIPETLPINNDGEVSPEKLNKLREYEAEAAGFAVQLLNDALNINLSQWFADWSHADWDYFVKITSLSNKPKSLDLKIQFGTDLISPKMIPNIKLREIPPQYAY